MSVFGVAPTTAELLLIELEAPVLEAELALVVAECAMAVCSDDLARCRLRKAEQRLLRVLFEQANANTNASCEVEVVRGVEADAV